MAIEHSRADASDVPDELRERLAAPDAELEELGFEALGWMRESEDFAQLFRHADPVAYALSMEQGVVFLSAGEDGRKLASAPFERPEWDGLAKHVWNAEADDSYTAQWQRHRDALAELADFEPRDISADELIAEWADSARRAAAGGRSSRSPHARRRLTLAAGSAAAVLVLALAWIALRPTASPPPQAVAVARPTRAELDRELDRREREFGYESLEVAQLLESFPPEPAPARAAALVRQLRLIAIYERAPERVSDLERARAALARLRAQ